MIVLDANILIRAVLGRRVRKLLETHYKKVRFFAPDSAISEAREHLRVSCERETLTLNSQWQFSLNWQH
jgi:predicted nucleic acid-binding protein